LSCDVCCDVVGKLADENRRRFCQLPRPNRRQRFEDGACVASSGGGLHARLDLCACRSDQQRRFNCRCSPALTRRGTERRVASRSRSSFPTLGPVDCGPFYPRNHHAWTLARLLWPPSQGYFCPCGTISRVVVRYCRCLCLKRTRSLPSLLARSARSLRKGPPRYRPGKIVCRDGSGSCCICLAGGCVRSGLYRRSRPRIPE
jgi:hypothetical protein